MSAILPSGKRAVAIKIDNGGDTSAGGFIVPGDRVDVVRARARRRGDQGAGRRGRDRPITILTNVRVLAIGQNVEEQNGKKVVTGANATLELDPDQVELVVLCPARQRRRPCIWRCAASPTAAGTRRPWLRSGRNTLV